jgi:predicted peptidase
MKATRLLLTAVCAFALTSCTTMKKTAASQSQLKSEKTIWRISKTVEMQHLTYLPPDYNPNSGKRWPLLLFLHGAGERGTNVQDVAINGPLKLVKQGRELPFIIVAPQCPKGQDWADEPLLALLEHAKKEYAVDTNRVYLTGLSMGGYATWRLGMLHPEKFAAIAPVCGGGSLLDVILPGRGRAALKRLPIWAFHGAKDTAVPVEESERMAKILKELGAKEVKLTIYPDAGHDSWTEAYNNPELYAWLLKHSR